MKSEKRKEVEAAMPGLPENVLQLVEPIPEGMFCGRCISFDKDEGRCLERGFKVRPADPGCSMFMAD